MGTNAIVMSLQDKLPKDSISTMTLRNELDKANATQKEEFAKNLPLLDLKSPAKVFWLGSFLFGNLGVGRFMVGDMKLGTARLLLFLATCVLGYFLLDSTLDEDLALAGGFFCGVLYVAMILWYVIDLFLTGKTLRKKNLDKCLKLASGLSPTIISIMEKMPKQALKIEDLQKQILALDENRRRKALKEIEDEISSPFATSVIMIVGGFGLLVLMWYVFYEWIAFSHENKIVNGIWGLSALVWLVCLFKGESVVRDANFEDAEKIINKKDDLPANSQKSTAQSDNTTKEKGE